MCILVNNATLQFRGLPFAQCANHNMGLDTGSNAPSMLTKGTTCGNLPSSFASFASNSTGQFCFGYLNMAINYVEKGQGLHDAIATAGHWLKQQSNGIWVSSNDVAVQAIIDNYPLDNCKAELKSRIDEHAKIARFCGVGLFVRRDGKLAG